VSNFKVFIRIIATLALGDYVVQCELMPVLNWHAAKPTNTAIAFKNSFPFFPQQFLASSAHPRLALRMMSKNK
jgi:hypothetical protein